MECAACGTRMECPKCGRWPGPRMWLTEDNRSMFQLLGIAAFAGFVVGGLLFGLLIKEFG